MTAGYRQATHAEQVAAVQVLSGQQIPEVLAVLAAMEQRIQSPGHRQHMLAAAAAVEQRQAVQVGPAVAATAAVQKQAFRARQTQVAEAAVVAVTETAAAMAVPVS
jgi:hypothetical protein